jgi:hypothetical protein
VVYGAEADTDAVARAVVDAEGPALYVMVYGADGVTEELTVGLADTDGTAECDAEGRDVGLAV